MSKEIRTELCSCSKLKRIGRKCTACGSLALQSDLAPAAATAKELLASVSAEELMGILRLLAERREA